MGTGVIIAIGYGGFMVAVLISIMKNNRQLRERSKPELERTERMTEKAEAEIIENEFLGRGWSGGTSDEGGHSEYYYRYQYTFEVNGRLYQGEAKLIQTLKLKKKKIDVYYNPEDPSDNISSDEYWKIPGRRGKRNYGIF